MKKINIKTLTILAAASLALTSCDDLFEPAIENNLGVDYMYKNAHIFCKRKYERWLAFYESRRAYTLNSGKEMALQS